MKKSVSIVFFVLFLFSCGKPKSHAPYPGSGSGFQDNNLGDLPASTLLGITPIGELNQSASIINSHKDAIERSSVNLDYRSYLALEPGITGGNYPVYPRMTRTNEGRYLLFYHIGNSSTWAGNQNFLLISDDLKNWTYKGVFNTYKYIKDDFGYDNKRAFAGANVLRLSNGDILCVASYRALSGYGGHSYRENHNSSGIWLRRSKDDGKTWDSGMSIFTGMNWEPHMVELPSGDIHCYFTNSSILINRVEWPKIYNNAGTALVKSTDGGYTWTFEGDVVRQVRDKLSDITLFTDQMPVVICLNETAELAGAFESQMAKADFEDTDYWVSLAYSGDDKSFPVLQGNEVGPKDRSSAIYKGASPFLVQFPSGETVLVYNTNNIPYMRIGNVRARDFGPEIRYFTNNGFWAGLYVDGGHRLLASIGGSKSNLYFECLYLNHDIKASFRTAVVDGSNSEWEKTDDALFVGSKSQAQATLRCSSDKDSVYFLVEVLDENISISDYATIYLSSSEDVILGPSTKRIQLCPSGLKSEASYFGSWQPDELGVRALSGIEGTAGDAKDKDVGWLCELSLPKSKLSLKNGELIVNFALFDFSGLEDSLRDIKSMKTWPIISNL